MIWQNATMFDTCGNTRTLDNQLGPEAFSSIHFLRYTNRNKRIIVATHASVDAFRWRFYYVEWNQIFGGCFHSAMCLRVCYVYFIKTYFLLLGNVREFNMFDMFGGDGVDGDITWQVNITHFTRASSRILQRFINFCAKRRAHISPTTVCIECNQAVNMDSIAELFVWEQKQKLAATDDDDSARTRDLWRQGAIVCVRCVVNRIICTSFVL